MTDIGKFTESKNKIVLLLPWELWRSEFEVKKNDSLALIVVPLIRGPRETKERKGRGGGTSGRTRQASVRPHQSNDKVQNLDFLVIGQSKWKLWNVVKIRRKHLLTIPNERLQRWRNVLVVVRLFELVNGKRNREKEKGSLYIRFSRISVSKCLWFISCSSKLFSSHAQQQVILHKLHSYEVRLTIFHKIRKSVNSIDRYR